MKAMNDTEMLNQNGGINYFGAKFTCRVCGTTKRFWDWRTLFYDKDTCQVWFESGHFDPLNSAYTPKH